MINELAQYIFFSSSFRRANVIFNKLNLYYSCPNTKIAEHMPVFKSCSLQHDICTYITDSDKVTYMCLSLGLSLNMLSGS